MEGTTWVHGLLSQQTLALSLSLSRFLTPLFTADSNTACCTHCLPAHKFLLVVFLHSEQILEDT